MYICKMTTLTINIDNTKRKGMALLSYLKALSESDDFIIIDEVRTPNDETIQAIKDSELGRVNEYNSSEELFDKLGI